MAEKNVSRPHFEELTLHSEKPTTLVFIPLFFHGAVLVNKLGHTRVHLTAVRAPHSLTEFWATSRSCASALAHSSLA